MLIGPPSHPAGTRLVGDGSLMVAVPPEWARVAIGCDRRGELVVFSGREATVRCGHPGRARIRILTAHARTTGVEARIRLSDSPSPRLRRIVPIARHGEWIWRVLVLPVHEEVIVETPDRREGRRVIGSIQPLGTDLTAVPSVIGLGAAGAQERLRTAGLYASQSNDPSADGQGLPMVIIAQTPSPGTVIRIGSTISIGAEPGPPRPREVRR